MGLVNLAGDNSSALTDAVDWLRGVLLGTIGTATAIIAIAGVGLLMLSGRLPVRRGATTVFGCFILFSAGTVANGLMAGSAMVASDPTSAPEPPAYEATVPTPVPYDPYEGAAAPVRLQSDGLK